MFTRKSTTLCILAISAFSPGRNFYLLGRENEANHQRKISVLQPQDNHKLFEISISISVLQ
jgi:hypothetical protein